MKNFIFTTTLITFFVLFSTGKVRAQATEDTPRTEVGVHFSSLSINQPDSFNTKTEPGFGGRVTYNLNDSFALEAEGDFFPRRVYSFSSTSGGNAFQGQFGVKAGKRYRKFGIFAKARPGFITFSRVQTLTGFSRFDFNGQPSFFPNFRSERKTYFTTDVGGVIELYPSRRIVTRFDIGDTIIRYGKRDGALFFGEPGTPPTVFSVPGETRHNFQFSAGVGFRF